MPLVNRLDFARSNLALAYRASPEPQQLYLDVVARAPPAEVPMAHWCIAQLLDTINSGGAGGAVFSPSQGFARCLTGPQTPAEASTHRYQWTLEIAAVAPRFMRNFVEELRRAGMEQPITAMRIAGALPPDRSPLSVTEHEVRAWLDDPTAYLEAWPTPGFPVTFTETNEGALLRIELGERITPALRLELERVCVLWINSMRNCAAELGGDVSLIDVGKVLPVFAQTKVELRARYGEFLYLRAPAQAMIVNLLQRFHDEVAPLAALEVVL